MRLGKASADKEEIGHQGGVIMSNTLFKNSQGYGYKYTDISEIHRWLEENDIEYYQYIEPIDGNDYIYTVPIINGEELTPRRGCRVIVSTLNGKSNPAQEQGSGITYARRYSLLMAFGLATSDDDANSMTVPKVEGEEVQETPKEKKAKKEVIKGYPDKKKMIEVIKKHYPEGSDVLGILLYNAGVEKVEDMSEAQMAAVYNKYGGR